MDRQLVTIVQPTFKDFYKQITYKKENEGI